MSDLVERLTAVRVIGFTGGGYASSDGCGTTYGESVKQLVNPDGPKAADLIQSQAARIKVLEEALRAWQTYTKNIGEPDEGIFLDEAESRTDEALALKTGGE